MSKLPEIDSKFRWNGMTFRVEQAKTCKECWFLLHGRCRANHKVPTCYDVNPVKPSVNFRRVK